MLWFILSLSAAMIFAITQVFDNYFINRLFKNHLFSSIFYGHMSKAVMIFLFFIFFVREMFPIVILPALIVIALTELTYLLFYFKSLKIEDTSVVSALFSLGKIFIPVLAFLTIGEVLTTSQYVGFVLIILSGAFLALHQQGKKLKLNASFFFMGIATSLLAIQAVAYKFIFENAEWAVGYTWAFIFMGVTMLTMLAFRMPKRQIVSNFNNFRKKYYIVIGNAFLSLVAWGATTYAIALTDVSLVKGIGSTEPFFVLVYALVFKNVFPSVFKEHTDKTSILKKVLLFIVLIAGILIMVL